MNVSQPRKPEPWLSGSLRDVPAIQRAVLHSLELAREDLEHWCGDLSEDEINIRPADWPSIAFHVRHIARSLDRLLTYAEGRELDAAQLAALKSEMEEPATKSELFSELRTALELGGERILRFDAAQLEEGRTVGKKQLPTTLGGLLVHIADHTQRHVGQAITTAKIIAYQRRK